jgi:alpha-glucosidase
VKRLASHAHQLAKAVCLYSPWQFLFWYDKPASVQDEPELEFFTCVPTAWDETRVLQGRIGEYAVIARRRGAEWYIGFLNSGDARSLDVPLRFLDAGKKFHASIFFDDAAVPTRTHVKIEGKTVEQGSVLSLKAATNGGVAVRIVPQ